MKICGWLLGLLCWCSAQAVVSVQDDAGQTLTLSQPARRIVSLAPSLTELAFAAGAGERVRGVVEYSDFPAAARRLPIVGSSQRLDLETLVRLKPDLVLVWWQGNPPREIEKLRALNLPLFFWEPQRIADMPSALRRMGLLAGTEPAAEAAARAFEARWADLQKRYSAQTPLQVFFQVAQKPLLTLNDQHIISDAIRVCGGVNVFGKLPTRVPTLSTESVVAAKPQVIIASGERQIDDLTPRRARQSPSFQAWQRFGEIPAIAKAALWLLPADQISRSGPRILDGAESLCRALALTRRIYAGEHDAQEKPE